MTNLKSTNEPAPTDHIASPSPTGPPSNHRSAIIAAIAVAVLVAGGIFAYSSLRGGTAPQSAYDKTKLSGDQKKLLAQDDAFATQYLRGCRSDRKVSFTNTPVPLEQLGYIEPMGKMQDGHVTPTDHVYLTPLNQRAADNTTDVVMPADGTIINISAMPAQFIGDRGQQTAPEDHRVVIAHDCQYVSIFIHVHQLSDTVKAALGGALSPNTQKDITLELKAGDKIGKIGGNPVDWSLMDANKKLTGLITPDLYKSEPWKIHVIDPLSVYPAPLKSQLVAKGLRTLEPLGGKIDYDQRGKLIGNWFRTGTNGYMGASPDRYYDGHLSIAPDYIDPTHTIVSLGNWAGKSAQLAVKGTAKADSVTSASGPTKYELVALAYDLPSGQPWMGGSMSRGMAVNNEGTIVGTVLFEVMSGEKLKVETFPGKTAAQVTGFTGAAQTYVR